MTDVRICVLCALLAGLVGTVGLARAQEVPPECPAGSTFLDDPLPGDPAGFCVVGCGSTDGPQLVVRTYFEDGTFTDTGLECQPPVTTVPPAVEPAPPAPVEGTPVSTG